MVERIALIGLSGSGKSCVAPLVAARLGWKVIDTDRLVEERFGLPISEIFRRYGESVFRAAEREALSRACQEREVVIATGGGVVLDEQNWVLLRSGTAVVFLAAQIATLVKRLRADMSNDTAIRPLLAGDLEARLRLLWNQRQHLYNRSDIRIDTDDLPPAIIADQIVDAVRERASHGLFPFLSLLGASGRSDLFVHSGLITALGELSRQRWPGACRAFLITDNRVAQFWASSVKVSLQQAHFEVRTIEVPAGESSKSLETVRWLLDELLASRIERSDIVVALGGGVVGDLAGFVASIVLRGVGLIQVPTSLLAMVDASVGGKTGVDHRLGKNLIGTFYQPHLVIADPATLLTLPEEERRSGWAEVVKHAMIECTALGTDKPHLLSLLETRAFTKWWREGALDEVIRQNIRIKASVVAKDERETGLRRILNYGHTLGHAIEAASAYQVRHGEAVALGLRFAARLAHRLGLCSAETVALQDNLLDAAALPRTVDVSETDVLARLQHDKKRESGVPTWILPTEPGHVVLYRDVTSELIEESVGCFLKSHSLQGI